MYKMIDVKQVRLSLQFHFIELSLNIILFYMWCLSIYQREANNWHIRLNLHEDLTGCKALFSTHVSCHLEVLGIHSTFSRTVKCQWRSHDGSQPRVPQSKAPHHSLDEHSSLDAPHHIIIHCSLWMYSVNPLDHSV